MKYSVFFSLVVLSALACSKPGSQPGSDVTITSAPAAPPKAAEKQPSGLVVNIPKLGLKGTAPGETEAPTVGQGDPALIMASKFIVTLSEAKPTDPKSLKDGKDAADLFNPTNLKSENLADGWLLTYENTGGMGTNYFVTVRREIGGKAYLCQTAQNTPEQQKLVVDFCKSLSK